MNVRISFFLILLLTNCTLSENQDDDFTKDIKIIELRSNNCTIFLKRVTWGLTGDNSITYISKNPYLQDTVREPYFRTLDFFYKLDSNNCQINVYHSDSLRIRGDKTVKINIFDGNEINYSNYRDKGYENIFYQ